MRLKDKLPSVAFALAEAILFFAIQLTGGTLCASLCYTSVLLALVHAMYVFFKLSVAENTFLYAVTHTGINLVWLFYVPSQTLISLSELFSEERKEIKYV